MTTAIETSSAVLRKHLEDTLDRLKTYGWVKKQFGDRYHTGGFCIFGAAADVGAPYSVANALAGTLRDREEYKSWSELRPTTLIINFNDRPDTEFADVEELFEHTIAGLD